MGNRIKQLQLQAHMTQEELGKIIDVNKAAIQKYESGHITNIKRRKISALCGIFNVSPTWLMGFDEDFEKESELNRKATKETRVIDDAADIFGNAAQDFLSLLKRLDEIDRAKIMERMETMLENDKYQK